jgi:diguanylate cyclase (GGDEF)-like protein
MRGWLALALVALFCATGIGGRAAAQQVQLPPPPPPGQNQPGAAPRGPWPPPPPPPSNADNSTTDPASTNDRRPPPPPPPPPPPLAQQPQQQQPLPQAAASSSTTATTFPAPASTATDASEGSDIPHATIDPEAAAWAQSSTSTPDVATTPATRNTQTTFAASPPDPVAHPQTQMMSYWPWLLALALSFVLLLLSMALRKTVRLENETEQLARHQRVLQHVNRNLQDQSEHLRHLAINDPLTGVLNRRAFADELRALLDHLSRFGRPLNLIVFDLDHFKAINDQQGHLAGDVALKLVAGVVHKHLNSDDLFGRFGGDEFLIACADSTLDETAQIADGIRRMVVDESTACDPPLPGLSLSIGIARASPETGYLVDALFQRADTALYAAKRGGRNRVVLASDDLPRPPASEVIARQLA